jgi:SARP family transcriptional regulator, regulator of embCAB operon
LGIDPGWTIRELYERILRQEPLDARKVAQSHAEDTIVAQSDNAIQARRPATAALVGTDGRRYPLAGTATRIGRSPDNDIVLSDAKVSRHHAVITDDGRAIFITDLGSANGVRVGRKRIDPSAELHEGDRIRIGDEQLTLETGTDPTVH